MALTALTRVQQAALLALVEARRLDVSPADVARANSFLRQAQERQQAEQVATTLVDAAIARGITS